VTSVDSSPVLIIAAHPDDEAIGLGGQLAGFRQSFLVHTTDGAPRAHTNRTEYASIRRGELEAALGVAGIPASNALALGAVDQESPAVMAELARELAAIIDRLRPDTIFTHAYEGGHPDHDAAAFVVHVAVRLALREDFRHPVVREFTSYHNGAPFSVHSWMRVGEFLPWPESNQGTVVLSLDARDRKRRMFECFASQRHMLDSFPIALERTRLAPAYDFTIPPHEGRLFYEDQDWGWDGASWRHQARRALEELHLNQ
jgi:LmbE family N-acetylglucosaminyl deacetylase